MFFFKVLFVNFLSYLAVKYVQQLEEISKSSKYCLGYILKLLVKLSLFCVVIYFILSYPILSIFWRGGGGGGGGGVAMACGEQVTNWYYFIQSSFALHSLHFEFSHISLLLTLYCIIFFCVSLQSPSMSEGPLIFCP